MKDYIMKLTTNQLRRIIREEVSKVLTESAGLSAEMLGIDLDSLNPEQKRFLDNLLAMNSSQLASQYSDITKEMSGRRFMVSPGTPDVEVIKMILDEAYPELDVYGYEPAVKPQSLSDLIKDKLGMNENNLTEGMRAPSVEEVVTKYKMNPQAWRMARLDFEDMADSGDGGGIRDEYYPGWSDEDFQVVLARLGA